MRLFDLADMEGALLHERIVQQGGRREDPRCAVVPLLFVLPRPVGVPERLAYEQ